MLHRATFTSAIISLGFNLEMTFPFFSQGDSARRARPRQRRKGLRHGLLPAPAHEALPGRDHGTRGLGPEEVRPRQRHRHHQDGQARQALLCESAKLSIKP